MKDKEFLEFMLQGETVPAELKATVKRDISLSFQGRTLTLKFISFQVLGALISLAFCPQFGLSFFVEGHGFTHALRMIGDWACALFCGSLFLSSGTILALFSMKGEELAWVWSHKKLTLIFLPALFWGVLMLLNIGLKLPKEDGTYHLTWILAAMGIQWLMMKLRIFRKGFIPV